MRTLLHRLRTDERGTSLVELALVAPILSLMTIGIIDLSNGFSQKLQLEQVAQRSIERLMNGRTTDMAAVKTEAATAAGVPETNVTTDVWLECNGARAANYNSTCSPGQTYARYRSVSITKNYVPFFSYKLGSQATNSYTLTGAAAVRTQ